MDGVLVVDKPAGPTSHDVVARARRALGLRRIGHTGTLDPMASGVLPLVLGKATRLARFLTLGDKAYEARVRLGVRTDTYDMAGTPMDEASGVDADADVDDGLAPSPDRIERALSGFRGAIRQTPPPFSAKKVDGERAYRRARRGETVRMTPVGVTVHRLEHVGGEGWSVDLLIECSAGFYVRSLAHDLGEALGCGAALERLRRVRSGGFDLELAMPLDAIVQRPEEARGRVVGLPEVLPGMPAVVLSAGGARRAAHGQDVGPADLARPSGPTAAGLGPVRLLTMDGRLLGIAEPRPGDGALHPVVVLS